MFEEIYRMQHYCHQLLQQAKELDQQAYRLHCQAEEALSAIHPEAFAGDMLSAASETARHMQQTAEMIRKQADEIRQWLDNAALTIPLAPPPDCFL